MTRKAGGCAAKPAPGPQPTPGQLALLDALVRVMRGTQGPQALPDVLRRLNARKVKVGASSLVDAVVGDQGMRVAAGQEPRFAFTADKRLSWLGDSGIPVVKPVPSRKPTVKVVQKARPDEKAGELPAPVQELQRKATTTRKALLRQMLKLTPTEFEKLCARIMTAMGVQDVRETPPTNDAGVDVRGLLVIEDLIRIRVAVQVKRYTGNVSRPEVQKLRGSLSHGEVGWFMTTGDYSTGAREEAKASDRQPISLLNGLEIADLVLKYGVPLRDEGDKL